MQTQRVRSIYLVSRFPQAQKKNIFLLHVQSPCDCPTLKDAKLVLPIRPVTPWGSGGQQQRC